MANLILGNTTGEICCEIQQSYMRLTGNYVGPLCTSSNSLSGFLIRDANNNSGIYVANCAIQTCKNKIEYTDTNSSNPAYIALPANKCLHISGNNSVFSFSNVGNFSAGSGIYSAFNGIQSFSSSPSFTLIPNTATINNAFRSLNCSCQVQFYICQSGNSGVFLSGSNVFRFDNLDKQGAYYISGNSTSVSGLPLSNYSFVNYGNSYFNANSLFSGNLNITGTGCFNASHTGLDVNTRSIFRKDIIVSGNICLTGGGSIISNGLFSFATGNFGIISGQGDLISRNACLNSIIATSITGTANSCFQCIKVSGLCVTSGCFNDINALSTCSSTFSGNSFLGGSLSGLSVSGQTFAQLNGSTITCFTSSGFHLGTICTGYIKAINTAKAWGRITVIDGIQRELVGYNIKSHQVYATAMPPVAASTIYAHGICFCEPIKYPFSVIFNVYASGNPIIVSSATNLQPALPAPGGTQLGFTGAATSAIAGLGGSTTFPNAGAIFYALSGKNAAGNALSAYTNDSCYSEIYFNLTNPKGPGTIYSELTAQNSDAIINFTIFGS